MGSTAAAAFVLPDRVVAATVGDSQAVLCRGGLPINLTEQHRVWGNGPHIDSEVARVSAAGGWVSDGRVCDVLAVSRAFGDWEFKGRGLQALLAKGLKYEYWDAAFAGSVRFASDPVIPTPDVSQLLLGPEDEFLIVASDGLWESVPLLDAVRWGRKELTAGKPPAEVAASLAALAIKRHTSDNVGVVIVDLKGRDHWAAVKGKAAQKKGGMFGGLFG